MNLAQITQFINDKIRNKIPKVVKIELADVQQAIVNEIFTGIVIEDNTVSIPFENIINLSDAFLKEINFNIIFKKIGTIVFYQGYLKQSSNYPYLETFLTLKFKDTIYKPKSLAYQYGNANNFEEINSKQVLFVTGGVNPSLFIYNSSIIRDKFITINGHYITEN